MGPARAGERDCQLAKIAPKIMVQRSKKMDFSASVIFVDEKNSDTFQSAQQKNFSKLYVCELA
jgi:hypothetical protein